VYCGLNPYATKWVSYRALFAASSACSSATPAEWTNTGSA
jgi:hypothetical protein